MRALRMTEIGRPIRRPKAAIRSQIGPSASIAPMVAVCPGASWLSLTGGIVLIIVISFSLSSQALVHKLSLSAGFSSDAAWFVTGLAMAVDGGWTAQ